jgi:hypothetical protein
MFVMIVSMLVVSACAKTTQKASNATMLFTVLEIMKTSLNK